MSRSINMTNMNTMTKEGLSYEEKEKIAEDLRAYVEKAGSMNAASKMLKRVSVSYISQMLGGKWEAMSDEAWINLKKQVSTSYSGEWQIVNSTKNFAIMESFYDDARKFANTFGIIGNAGWGKTCTSLHDRDNKANTFLIRCNEFHNRMSFLRDLLSQMGKEDSGYSVAQMMATVITHIRKLDHPLIIIDEADKLSDPVLYFFISLYNSLEGECGLVMTGAPFLEKRITDGARRNKKGYKEILSRLGGKFIELNPPTPADQAEIIRANGITDRVEIQRIINESDADLRRVKRLVHASIRKSEQLKEVA